MKLAGISEIAELLGVSRQRAWQIAEQASFPRPADRLASGPVWREDAVRRWAEKHR